MKSVEASLKIYRDVLGLETQSGGWIPADTKRVDVASLINSASHRGSTELPGGTLVILSNRYH